ncbi:hypothetical protein [Bdellovibrio sp. NC01]|uniref:hypothetical protein n=1 Tax=Bdellovibrio sp. NC01 TaxID=2220073 RepID=UPI00115758B7|nr:hypothetical protein [Bdellovibrio sp. NC01]QDK36752.1 hypothetical protein DOE51_03615 [Bdellovibrio sp. NC01]
MSKKKKTSSAAENLIESLMDDLKDIQADSSYHNAHVDAEKNDFEGLPMDTDENRVDSTNVAGGLWDNLEKDLGVQIEKDIVASEFTGGAHSEYDGSDNDGYEGSDSGAGKIEEFEMPEGFGELPPSERFMMNSAEEEKYQGPSSDGGYQSSDELFSPPQPEEAADDEATRPVAFTSAPSSGGEDKTISIQQDLNLTSSVAASTSGSDADKTVAVDGFANARVGGARKSSDVDVKVSVGNFRGSSRTGAANVLTSVDASLAQAENLKLAQQRILELEREVEHLRAENEELASAGEIIRTRTDELGIRISAIEKEKAEVQESAQSEILILKGNLQYKENEVAKARIKVEELETRLKSDFKKIRVRERELENRLELLRAEKAALVRSKDEYILDQKRKIDQLSQELDNYRKKCLELNKTLEANQDQFKRTERALRLALTNLEVKEENLTPLKKAE